MSMKILEWMICNSCWFRVANRQSQFHLTQCGHVYCDKCISKAEEKCVQCGSVQMISLPLKEPLSPQIAHFFARPSDLLEKATQAQQFQENQLSLCLKRANENADKYQALKEAYWVNAENTKNLYKKYNKLKMALAFMKKEREQLKVPPVPFTPSQYRTPPNQISSKYQEKNYHGNYIQNKGKKTDEGFIVPTITRVPKSAGYYTGSSMSTSSSSSYRPRDTPNSNFSNY